MSQTTNPHAPYITMELSAVDSSYLARRGEVIAAAERRARRLRLEADLLDTILTRVESGKAELTSLERAMALLDETDDREHVALSTIPGLRITAA